MSLADSDDHANNVHPPQPQGVPIQVLPESWVVGQVVGPDGHVWTQIQISGPYGVMVHMLSAQAARSIGLKIQKAGSSADLIIPGAGG